MTPCPFCAEDIQDAAIVCKHFRRDIPARPNPLPVPANAPARPMSAIRLLLYILLAGVVGIVG
jgi:hypothetical protein